MHSAEGSRLTDLLASGTPFLFALVFDDHMAFWWQLHHLTDLQPKRKHQAQICLAVLAALHAVRHNLIWLATPLDCLSKMIQGFGNSLETLNSYHVYWETISVA